MREQAFLACVPLLLALSLACSMEPGATLPEAYVAPAAVNVRSQLNQKNSTVAVLKHGDRVGIVDVRRRFVKVRTNKGAEGWVDSGDLLHPEEMRRIEREREQALLLPVEAAATAYENLNIHLSPSRASPAFAQIAEGGTVSVLARKVVPRIPAANSQLVPFEKLKPPARTRRKGVRKINSRQPPMPPAPKAPTDSEKIWGSADRSESGEQDSDHPVRNAQQVVSKKAQKATKPPVMEAWNLVRTRNNQVGWVLTRNLMISIPDDVAQYAEGKHITSYFDLGTVNDEERGPRHNWLWTTAAGSEAGDFDSWRVFLWNRHRHRYETSYRERELEGYFPVHVESAEPSSSPGRTFELITKDEDGRRRRRTYRFDGTRVHLTATEDLQASDAAAAKEAAQLAGKHAEDKRENGWWQRSLTAWKARLSGAH